MFFRVILSEAKNLLRLLPYISQYPSIHIKDVAVDRVRGVGRQKYRGTGKFRGLQPAASRGLGANEGIEWMAASVRLNLPERSGLRRGYISRTKSVALDIILPVLGAYIPGLQSSS